MITALELFAQRGYDGVSVRDIAAELGISAPALYKHYISKKDIFESILRRMEENDKSKAEEAGVPEDVVEKDPVAYKSITIDEVVDFSLEMFKYWTEDPFAKNFRKVLTVERHRNPKMSALFEQYLGDGVLKYLEDIFREMFPNSNPRLLAIKFYGPMFCMIAESDRNGTSAFDTQLLKEHFQTFSTMEI